MFEDFNPVDKQEWIEKVIQDLKGKSFDALKWEVEEDLVLDPFYTAEDVKHVFTLPFGRSSNPWKIAESIPLSDGPTGAKKANLQLITALEGGVESPILEIDEVLDKKGFQQLFKGVFPDMICPQFRGAFTESQPKALLQLFAQLLKDQQKNTSEQEVLLHVDPLGFFLEEQDFFEDESTDFNSIMEAVEFAKSTFPKARIVKVSGHYLHNNQNSLARELAFMLAFASEYMYQLTNRGLSPEVAASSLFFSLSAGGQFFVELAKIRALKLLWMAIQRAYGVEVPEEAVIHVVTSSKTQVEDQNTNMISATTEALSAVLGGIHSLDVLPANVRQEAPTAFTRRIARNVQHLMKSESHLDWVSDPAAGSYYLENLTTKLAHLAWTKFQKLEANGGVLAFLKA
ncbi:MAG: methylmalonyl-CoA mutase family protein [Bacteroidota bacterium]